MTELKKDMESIFAKALGLSLNCLARQPRTKKYLREYLEKKQYQKPIIAQVLDYLQNKNYVNDLEYSQWFIKSRNRNNPKSKRALFYELRQKGVNPDVFTPLLDEIDEQSLAFEAIHRKIESWKKNYDREKCKKKVFSYLSYRGFNFHIIQTVWNKIGRDI